MSGIGDEARQRIDVMLWLNVRTERTEPHVWDSAFDTGGQIVLPRLREKHGQIDPFYWTDTTLTSAASNLE